MWWFSYFFCAGSGDVCGCSTGYGPQCLSAVQQGSPSTASGHGSPGKPLGAGHPPGQHTHQHEAVHKMTNQHIQPPTPTPSDVSSISARTTTPRAHFYSSAADQVNFSVNSATKDDHFLIPGPVVKPEPWGAFKILPDLPHASAHHNSAATTTTTGNSTTASEQPAHPGSAWSHYPSSTNSLAPYFVADVTPTCSHITSPRQSANRNNSRKRPLSLSPEGLNIDINNLMRCSPTTLIPSILSSRGSSSNASPLPANQQGSVGHLAARHSSQGCSPNGSHTGMSRNNFLHYSQTHFKKEQDYAYPENNTYLQMVDLETSSEPSMGSHDGMQNNMMVMGQQQNLAVTNGHYPDSQVGTGSQEMHYNMTHPSGTEFKQEAGSNAVSMYGDHMHGHIPSTSMQNSMPCMESHEASMPPPPPYSEVISNQAFENSGHYDGSPQENGVIDPKTEIAETEGEAKKLICRWIDCNQMFLEQDDLVRHIEKAHIDQRKGEDFTCFWAACQRRYKPFNARYKLLIHMRVHSGEKPNKCTVSKFCCFLFSHHFICTFPNYSDSGKKSWKCRKQENMDFPLHFRHSARRVRTTGHGESVRRENMDYSKGKDNSYQFFKEVFRFLGTDRYPLMNGHQQNTCILHCCAFPIMIFDQRHLIGRVTSISLFCSSISSTGILNLVLPAWTMDN